MTEQTLIAPAYKCFFLLDMDDELHRKIDDNLSKYHAEYLPYLGKNEFSVWWENHQEYEFSNFDAKDSFKIKSIYIKDQPIEGARDIQPFSPFITNEGNSFSFFERLPIGYTDIGNKNYQYEYRNFAYTDWTLKADYEVKYQLLKLQNNEVIQIF